MGITKQEKAMRERAREIITSKVAEISKLHGYRYNRIAIKNQKTRLGSCSSKGNLNFNWQIIKFPQEVMEYIVKHELAHLVQQNHSKAFWAEVYKLEPNYKAHHKWIKENAHKYLSF